VYTSHTLGVYTRVYPSHTGQNVGFPLPEAGRSVLWAF